MRHYPEVPAAVNAGSSQAGSESIQTSRRSPACHHQV